MIRMIQLSLRLTPTRLLQAMLLVLAFPAWADGSPWEAAITPLQNSLAKVGNGLSLIAVVVAGLLIAFGENNAKKTLGGIIFGVAILRSAPVIIDWLFYQN